LGFFVFKKRRTFYFRLFLKQKMCTRCTGLYLQERSKREDQSLSAHINHNPNAKHWDFFVFKGLCLGESQILVKSQSLRFHLLIFTISLQQFSFLIKQDVYVWNCRIYWSS